MVRLKKLIIIFKNKQYFSYRCCKNAKIAIFGKSMIKMICGKTIRIELVFQCSFLKQVKFRFMSAVKMQNRFFDQSFDQNY
jgi:hypothetical protein